MIKKSSLIFVTTLLIGLFMAGPAFAQSPTSEPLPRGGRRGIGEIVRLEVDAMIVRGQDGADVRLRIDEHTRFHTLDLSPLVYADLQSGDLVAVTAARDGAESWVARVVILLPLDYDASQRLGIRAVGRVQTVDRESSSLKIATRNGELLDLTIGEYTTYRGEVESFDQLNEGMAVVIAGLRQENGQILAVLVAARQIRHNFVGEVFVVYAQGAGFSLRPRSGAPDVRIGVNEDTVFNSRAGTVASLEDLQPGDMVAVRAVEGLGAELIAKRVLALSPDQLPELDLRTTGVVKLVGENSIQVETPDGQVYTIVITEATRMRVPGPQFGLMPDLHPGMRVAVAARQIDSGEYEAVTLVRLRQLR